MTRASKISSSLSKLIRKSPTLDEIFSSIDEPPNDRAKAIIYAINLENELEKAISEKMVPLTNDETARLFIGDAPLASFSAKIRIAYAMGIIGRKTRRDLDIIRSIRNVFAHARKPVRFGTPEITEACAKLRYLERVTFSDAAKKSSDPWPPIEPYKQYATTAALIAYALLKTSIGTEFDLLKKYPGNIKLPLD